MQTQQNMSWRQKVSHDVKYIITFTWKRLHHDVKNTSRHQNDFLTSKSSSWHQKVRHEGKKFFMTLKVFSGRQKDRHNIKHFFVMSKVRHNVTKCIITSTTSWCQKYVITSKIRHCVKHYSITSFVHHNVKNLWRYDVKMFFITQIFVMKPKSLHDVKSSSWCQKVFLRHEVKKCHHFKNTSWRQKVSLVIIKPKTTKYFFFSILKVKHIVM